MSEQQKKSGGSVASGVLVVEKSNDKQPYRPTELQDENERHKNRTPIVPSVAEELKRYTEESGSIENRDFKELQEFAAAPISDKRKQNIAKNLSPTGEIQDHSPESIKLSSVEFNRMKVENAPIPEPIPDISPVAPDIVVAKEAKAPDEDSITEEVEETNTAEVAKKHSEWSDDEEAGGLPRSDSRASRVSRLVRQLFCCGVSYQAPSEDDVSVHRGYAI